MVDPKAESPAADVQLSMGTSYLDPPGMHCGLCGLRARPSLGLMPVGSTPNSCKNQVGVGGGGVANCCKNMSDIKSNMQACMVGWLVGGWVDWQLQPKACPPDACRIPLHHKESPAQ